MLAKYSGNHLLHPIFLVITSFSHNFFFCVVSYFNYKICAFPKFLLSLLFKEIWGMIFLKIWLVVWARMCFARPDLFKSSSYVTHRKTRIERNFSNDDVSPTPQNRPDGDDDALLLRHIEGLKH